MGEPRRITDKRRWGIIHVMREECNEYCPECVDRDRMLQTVITQHVQPIKGMICNLCRGVYWPTPHIFEPINVLTHLEVTDP